MRVFVSYRRVDVGGFAGRLNDALAARLGGDMVFLDVAAIGAGRDFVQEIDRALAEADAVLAVIGPGWLHASSADGERRLLQPDDFVRTELVRGLASGLPVVPVLVGGAALPMAADLPSELSPLVDRQAVIIRDEAFHDDVDRLIASLRGGPSSAGPRHRGRLIALVTAAAVLVAVGGTVAFVLHGGGSAPTSSAGGNTFSADSPWRLLIEDKIQNSDNGCTITLTDVDSGAATLLPVASWADSLYGNKTLQIHQAGSFRWQANDPGCLVTPLAGSGTTTLPFIADQMGDSDAFVAPPLVAVQVKDYHSNPNCQFKLYDAADGQALDLATANAGTDTVILHTAGRQKVYVGYEYSCAYQVSAAN